MRSNALVVLATAAALGWAPDALAGALTGPVLDEGQRIVLEDLVQLPGTAGPPPFTRINGLREAPDGSGRLFLNDLDGPLYAVEDGNVTLYLDLAQATPVLKTEPSLAPGFTSFAFAPDFATSGLFYTVHTEVATGAIADLGPPLPTAIVQHEVLAEWRAFDPSAPTFAGTAREVLRIASPHEFHNLGQIDFRPGAQPGDEDYGLLYIGAGDFGSVQTGQPEQLQRLDGPYGALLRIDPGGGPFLRDGLLHGYGIPPGNPFVQVPTALGEIYALGFRNAHRFAWDTGGSEALIVTDIGQSHIEEIDLVEAGDDHGWPQREGTFRFDPLLPDDVGPLPQDDGSFGFRYPAAQYDHDEGRAIAGGYVYAGRLVPELDGRFVTGDIVTGRLLSVRLDELLATDSSDPTDTAPLYELGVVHRGVETTLLDVVRGAVGDPGLARADLRFGQDLAGELYVTTKQDGFLRRVAPLRQCNDGLDNDGDGLADLDDPGCPIGTDPKEGPVGGRCGLGAESALGVLAWALVRSRRKRGAEPGSRVTGRSCR